MGDEAAVFDAKINVLLAAICEREGMADALEAAIRAELAAETRPAIMLGLQDMLELVLRLPRH